MKSRPNTAATINRMEFGPEIRVNYDFFSHRVAPEADPGIVLIGYRSLASYCRIEPAGTLESWRSILADCVVGLGLHQGLEFVIRSNPFELASKPPVAISRLTNARRLFYRSAVYRLILGRNHRENARAISALVKNAPGERRLF